MIELSVILPVHNEEMGIEKFLKNVASIFSHQRFSYEIFWIENGSTDNSFFILNRLCKKYKKMSVLQSEKGWGNAVRKGIKEAKGRYICYMVSDGQIDPKYIPILYKVIQEKEVDMVKVSRASRENLTRLVNSRIYNFLARLMFGLMTIDINGTPKILETRLARKLNLVSRNIAIDLELLYKMKASNLVWTEILVSSSKRTFGFSTTNIKSVFEMLWNMIKFRVNMML